MQRLPHHASSLGAKFDLLLAFQQKILAALSVPQVGLGVDELGQLLDQKFEFYLDVNPTLGAISESLQRIETQAASVASGAAN